MDVMDMGSQAAYGNRFFKNSAIALIYHTDTYQRDCDTLTKIHIQPF